MQNFLPFKFDRLGERHLNYSRKRQRLVPYLFLQMNDRCLSATIYFFSVLREVVENWRNNKLNIDNDNGDETAKIHGRRDNKSRPAAKNALISLRALFSQRQRQQERERNEKRGLYVEATAIRRNTENEAGSTEHGAREYGSSSADTHTDTDTEPGCDTHLLD